MLPNEFFAVKILQYGLSSCEHHYREIYFVSIDADALSSLHNLTRLLLQPFIQALLECV